MVDFKGERMYYVIDKFEKKTPSDIFEENIKLVCRRDINVYLMG